MSALPIAVRQAKLPSFNSRLIKLGNSLSVALLGIFIAVLLWWLATGPLLIDATLLGSFSPGACLEALWRLLQSGEIFVHAAVSLQRVLLSLLFALSVGLPLGVAVGLSKVLEQATSPLFQFIRMISPISWMPLAVMMLGIGDAPVYFLLTIAAVWPIMLNVSAGVHAVDPRWLTLADSLCATRWETVTRIIVPAILAHTLTGIRLAIGIVWIVLVPAEMLGVSAGLGYFILDTRDRLAYSELMAVILVIGFIGYLLDALARLLIKRVHHRKNASN
ncbi:ABC transporter permease [Methylobacter sp.]|uniref:ABC transporter permease n=1 Tax=Methylobacter sp. TaxID=2051955 RepID=UPI00122A8206|nr:ABC transporter permease [Methylobacter sp.]TAK60093.1 MAG: ABC transporter permease [Methylobacter sp.]